MATNTNIEGVILQLAKIQNISPKSIIMLLSAHLARGFTPKYLTSSASSFLFKRAARSGLGSSTVVKSFSTNNPALDNDDAPTAADIAAVQEEFRANPASAKIEISSISKLTTGLRSTAQIRDNQFQIATDEPFKFGGSDTAPSPVEVIVASLGTCQEITYKAYAQAMSIPLKSVSLDLKGTIDMRGFFSVDPNVRPGIQEITGVATVETSADVTTEQIEELKGVVDSHCPVSDMLGAVPVTITLNHVQN